LRKRFHFFAEVSPHLYSGKKFLSAIAFFFPTFHFLPPAGWRGLAKNGFCLAKAERVRNL
jgi:hypothetical protein